MFCKICGAEFEGNLCPVCQTPANIISKADEFSDQAHNTPKYDTPQPSVNNPNFTVNTEETVNEQNSPDSFSQYDYKYDAPNDTNNTNTNQDYSQNTNQAYNQNQSQGYNPNQGYNQNPYQNQNTNQTYNQNPYQNQGYNPNQNYNPYQGYNQNQQWNNNTQWNQNNRYNTPTKSSSKVLLIIIIIAASLFFIARIMITFASIFNYNIFAQDPPGSYWEDNIIDDDFFSNLPDNFFEDDNNNGNNKNEPQDESGEPLFPNGVSRAEYAQIKTGMSYAEISSIIGGDAVIEEIPDTKDFTATWIGEYNTSATVVVKFSNNVAVSIEENGLY